MTGFRILRAANNRLDEIYDYTADTWGEAQADDYVSGLFSSFRAIAAREIPWRAIPADFGVQGYSCQYESHVIYWKALLDGTVGIVTILHERMHQIDHLKGDFA